MKICSKIWISQNLPPQEEWRGGGGGEIPPPLEVQTLDMYGILSVSDNG